MNADLDEAIRAEHTFFERSKIDKSKADQKRLSPDINEMYGAIISEPMASGGDKVTIYYWNTEERRKRGLSRVTSRYINPTVKLIKK